MLSCKTSASVPEAGMTVLRVLGSNVETGTLNCRRKCCPCT